MVGYPSVQRTAVPLWSPASLRTPLLATGTVSGALDASFSSDSILELWDPFADEAQAGDDLTPLASLPVGSRFNRLAWGYVKAPERPKGVIAAGLENGEIGLWDPEMMLNKVEGADPLIARYDLHKGPVRGLDFNPHQTNLLASGATNGEIYIWDLTTPNKPFSPGTRSRSIDDITALAWNSHVAHVLATGSNSGYTVVWDLKSKREVTALSYTAGGATGVGSGFGQPGWGGGGQRGVSAVQWHPDNPTKLATASDDDQNPIIMLWDLRNWKEPEKILTGHDKGILSLDWCSKDSDLLLSSGKDGRTLCWNPSSGEIVAEVTPSSNWSFDVQWCPRNPSLLSTASLDGKVSIHSIQSTAPVSAEPAHSVAASLDGADAFDLAISANAANYPTQSLAQTPKWLRRPSSAAFGFGGRLVSVSNGADGPKVEVRTVVGEPDVVVRALRLEIATEASALAAFCEARSGETEGEEETSWKLLGTLFGKESREELVELLGFSKEEIRSKVEDAIKALKEKLPSTAATGIRKTMSSGAISGFSGASDAGDDSTSIGREPLVTFADTPTDGLSASSQGEGAAANEGPSSSVDVDESITSGTSKEPESELTEPSLFGDNVDAPSSQSQAAADFYSQIGSGRPAALPDHVFGRDAVANSSVAATIGSASSVASLNLKPATFKIYPAGESDVDRLITKALVLGDFESAVELSLSAERYADAILLAVRGGPDLLARTQKAYFERQTGTLPYLRVFQSIVANDLSDVVQNANLAEWQEIFVVLCTFAKPDEFSGLAEQLGQRLEYAYSVARTSPSPDKAPELRKNAILCYLAAGQLEKVVGIWIQQMDEEELATKERDQVTKGAAQLATSQYEARARSLQTFVEKVTVFQQAVGYVDADLAQPTTSSEVAEAGARTYKLAALYERYVEYAELLASQGLVSVALKYIAQTPVDFQGLKMESSAPALTRDRLVRATGTQAASNVFGANKEIRTPATAPVASTSAATYAAAAPAKTYEYPTAAGYDQRYPSQPSAYDQPAYGTPAQQGFSSAQPNHDDPYAAYSKPQASQSAYQPQQLYQQQQPQQAAPSYPNSYAQPPAFPNVPGPYDAAPSFIPAPPAIRESSPNFAARGAAIAPPPPRAKPEGQWNDAPVIQRKATPAASPAPKGPAAITSPFPNSMPTSPNPAAFGGGGYGQGQVPPPPPSRGGNRTPAPVVPPPPQARGFGAQHNAPPMPTMSPPPPAGYPAQPQRFPAGPPPPPGPPRSLQQQGPGGFRGAPTPPPNAGQYGRPAPPPNAGSYGPPPGQQQQQQGRPNGPPAPSPYGPPAPPPGQYAPPSAPGPYGPPPGAARPPGPPGPPAFNNQPPPARAQPAPAPAPPKPEPPKSKYPAGDRAHIPEASKPIFNVLSNEIRRLKQVTPPQQAKMINDTEKRLNLLFDMLNCETLSEASHARILEIVKAIEGRNQAAALDLHLRMLTEGSTSDVSSFQAALKLVIQRMA